MRHIPFTFVIAMLCLRSLAAGYSLADYDRTLEKLSEPVETRWQHFGAPYFSTNEKLLNRFYSRFDNGGGVTVGVSFQQNLSLLVHARPKLCVIFDYNPGVTEILAPLMGQLIAESPTRREFLSKLIGADFTDDEIRSMVETRTPVATVLSAVMERAGPEKRKVRIDALRNLLRDKYLARLPAQATPYIRTQALKWIDMLENEELLTGTFFADALAPYQHAVTAEERAREAGWLSTEANYALVRDYWMTGRIIGITGDISGSSVAKLGDYLRGLHLEVTALYLSNVGLSIEGHFPATWFRDLYATLGRLPVTPRTLTLIAHGPWQMTAFVRSLKQAQWVYQTLADVPEQTIIRLHEAPLEVATQLGERQVIPALYKGLSSLNAPQPYMNLLRRVEVEDASVRKMTPDEFRTWAVKQIPGVDLNSPILKTISVTLLEAGVLSPAQ